mmetsp:Transcript_116478/g.325794  ORF Transcript_116478/g.325794 Transcript_116478/m.325794 type:complete len:263 (-) Transcript_116478:485-1273(-)
MAGTTGAVGATSACASARHRREARGTSCPRALGPVSIPLGRDLAVPLLQAQQARVDLRGAVAAARGAEGADPLGGGEHRAEGRLLALHGLVGPVVQEFVLQRLRRREPPTGSSAEQCAQKPDGPVRHALRSSLLRLVARGRGARTDRRDHGGARQQRRLVGEAAEAEDVGDDAEGPDVHVGAVRLPGHHLRRHEGGRPDHAFELEAVRRAALTSEPEIAQLHVPLVEEEVVRLNVAVRDAEAVDCGDAAHHASQHRPHGPLR